VDLLHFSLVQVKVNAGAYLLSGWAPSAAFNHSRLAFVHNPKPSKIGMPTMETHQRVGEYIWRNHQHLQLQHQRKPILPKGNHQLMFGLDPEHFQFILTVPFHKVVSKLTCCFNRVKSCSNCDVMCNNNNNIK
jgi:hypothetical protein